MADFQGGFLREKGNNKRIGQHGDTPFIFNQSGDDIKKNGNKMAVKKINTFLLFLTIIF